MATAGSFNINSVGNSVFRGGLQIRWKTGSPCTTVLWMQRVKSNPQQWRVSSAVYGY